MFRTFAAPATGHDPAAVTLLLNETPLDDLNSDGSPLTTEGISEHGYETANFRGVSRWRETLFTLDTWLSRRRQVLTASQDGCCPGHGNRRRRMSLQWCWIIVLGVLSVLGLFQLLVLIGGFILVLILGDIHGVLEPWGQFGRTAEGLESWPTDFTRDIRPIRCHSHNDYWRRVPLYSAISAGCISVEADVWLFDRELYVGHSTSSLARNRTLKALYIDPLIDILAKQNPTTDFHTRDNTSLNGVFDTDPTQALTLLIDFKTEGSTTWPYVVEALEPLRSANYLSHWNGTHLLLGPIVVVGTGNTPFERVISNVSNRFQDIFFDAPLDELWEEGSSEKYSRSMDGPHSREDPNIYTTENSYYASVRFGKAIGRLWRSRLSKKQLSLLRGQIRGAHRRGLMVRYWDLPDWPIGLRNHVWDVLMREGVDLLNVDDLKAASRLDWTEKGSERRSKP